MLQRTVVFLDVFTTGMDFDGPVLDMLTNYVIALL